MEGLARPGGGIFSVELGGKIGGELTVSFAFTVYRTPEDLEEIAA